MASMACQAVGPGRLGGRGRTSCRGGRVELAGGPRRCPRPDLLPAVPAGDDPDQRRPDVLEAFAGATSQIVPVSADDVRATLDVARAGIRGPTRAGGKVFCATSTSPIVVRGTHGFGRVTLVGLDVDGPPFATWVDRGLFWVKALDFRPAASTASANQARSADSSSRGMPTFRASSERSLEQFPGVRLVPFGWVAFFIFVYILLIGPGDYLFLRRVLRRMELTWITFPTIVVAVSLPWPTGRPTVAKGTELRVNQVDVVDVDIPSTGASEGRRSPTCSARENRDYDVAVVPLALDPGRRRRAPRPGDFETRILTWFGCARGRSPRDERREPVDPVSGSTAMPISPRGAGRTALGRPRADLEHEGLRPPAGRATTRGADHRVRPRAQRHRHPQRHDHQPARYPAEEGHARLPLPGLLQPRRHRPRPDESDSRAHAGPDPLGPPPPTTSGSMQGAEDDAPSLLRRKSAQAGRLALLQAILFHDSETTGRDPPAQPPLA